MLFFILKAYPLMHKIFNSILVLCWIFIAKAWKYNKYIYRDCLEAYIDQYLFCYTDFSYD